MKRKYFFLCLCLFIISCEGIDTNEGLINSREANAPLPRPSDSAPSESVANSADNFDSAISLSNIDQEQFRKWKNLYLSSSPILSSIDTGDIKFYLNLSLLPSSGESGTLNTYMGNISFKFQSNEEELIIDSAYTGRDATEIKYNYVYAYNNADGVVRYAWKAFFESKYGAFLIVLKKGIVNANNKVVFSMSNGILYYRHWGFKKGVNRELKKLGDNPKCWLRQGNQHGLKDLLFGFFDCRTWRSSFTSGGESFGAYDIKPTNGIDITRSLDPDEVHEYKYRQMIEKTMFANFHSALYPFQIPDAVWTFSRPHYDTIIGTLIKHRDQSYEKIYDALSNLSSSDRVSINPDFQNLISAIPIKLAGKSLSKLHRSIILETYDRLYSADNKALKQWDSKAASAKLKAMKKELLKNNLRLIGTEYGGRGRSGNQFYKVKPSATTLNKSMASSLPLWQTRYVKLADFSNSNIQMTFDLSGAAGIASLKKQNRKRGLSSVSRSLSSVKNKQDLKLFYKLLILGFGLLFAVFLSFIIRKKLAAK